MSTRTEQNPETTAMWIAATVVALVALLGAMAWLSEGDILLVTLIEQGLAWCF